MQNNQYKYLGQYTVMSITQGGCGIPFLAPPVYDYISTGKLPDVRRLKSPEEVQRIIIERAAVSGRRPGALGHVSFFAADETGFFVGELNGEPISCMSLVKYTENYAFLGTIYYSYRRHIVQ